MPFFSEETLQAVRAIPLYEVVRPVVDLKRIGKNWRGLSPFSNEKTPSFYVLADKNYFKCHSTGLAGDGISFVQETEKLSFQEAVEVLAERHNIELKYADGFQPDREARSLRQAILDIQEYAREHYHQEFMGGDPIAESVRRYWTRERGFSLELAGEFSIGFSPADGTRLMDILLKKNFSTEAIAKSGLFHVGRDTANPGSWFPVFRGRLMVPIRDYQGMVVAFTARQLDVTPRDHGSWKAKYINSPETPVFHKGQLLFNLDRARDAFDSAGRALLVEGQLDALRCWDVGLKEAVAPQGTSVTGEQLKLIKRYTGRVDVLLDNDAAGARAVLRMIPVALATGLEVHVISLPEAMDPDDFLRDQGAAGIQQLDTSSAIFFAGKTLLPGTSPSPEKRSQVLNQLFEMLANCSSEVVREGYFEEAVRATGASPAAARADYRTFFRNRNHTSSIPPVPLRKKDETKSSQTLTNLEGDLTWAILKNVEWAESLAKVIDHQWIRSNTIEGKLLSRILAQTTVEHIENPGDIYYLLESDEERACVACLQTDERPEDDMDIYVNEVLASMVRRHCRERVEHLNQEITKSGLSNNSLSNLRDLINERREINLYMQKGPFPTVSLSLPEQ